MEITAKLSQYRQAPRKVRLVGTLLKGMPVGVALLELTHRSKRAAPIFHKLLLSAIANAKTQGIAEDTLRVKGIRVDKGPVLKRSRPRAHGRAFPIHKHTSHIVITLTDVAADVTSKKGVAKGVTTEKTSAVKKKNSATPVTKKKVAATAK